MAHEAQQVFVASVKNQFPHFFRNVRVLDVGSLDINGNCRHYFDDVNYTGCDIGDGPNVDIVCKAHELPYEDETFDVIISCECFEHDMYISLTLKKIIRLLKPGGMFIFTCATGNRPVHGVGKDSFNSPFTTKIDGWRDYYRNLFEADIRDMIPIDETFASYKFSGDSIDLRFWGIKKGGGEIFEAKESTCTINQSEPTIIV